MGAVDDIVGFIDDVKGWIDEWGPPPIPSLFDFTVKCVLGEIPEGDENGMYDLSDAYLKASDELGKLMSDGNFNAAANIQVSWSGDGAAQSAQAEFQSYWESLQSIQQGTYEMATMTQNGGLQIETAKFMLVANAAMMIGGVIIGIASSWFFGVGIGEATTDMVISRESATQIGEQLERSLMQKFLDKALALGLNSFKKGLMMGGMMAGIDLLAQLKEGFEGHRDLVGYNGLEALNTFGNGFAFGAVGAPFSHYLGGAVGEGIGMGTGAALWDLLTKGHVDWNDVAQAGGMGFFAHKFNELGNAFKRPTEAPTVTDPGATATDPSTTATDSTSSQPEGTTAPGEATSGANDNAGVNDTSDGTTAPSDQTSTGNADANAGQHGNTDRPGAGNSTGSGTHQSATPGDGRPSTGAHQQDSPALAGDRSSTGEQQTQQGTPAGSDPARDQSTTGQNTVDPGATGQQNRSTGEDTSTAPQDGSSTGHNTTTSTTHETTPGTGTTTLGDRTTDTGSTVTPGDRATDADGASGTSDVSQPTVQAGESHPTGSTPSGEHLSGTGGEHGTSGGTEASRTPTTGERDTSGEPSAAEDAPPVGATPTGEHPGTGSTETRGGRTETGQSRTDSGREQSSRSSDTEQTRERNRTTDDPTVEEPADTSETTDRTTEDTDTEQHSADEPVQSTEEHADRSTENARTEEPDGRSADSRETTGSEDHRTAEDQSESSPQPQEGGSGAGHGNHNDPPAPMGEDSAGNGGEEPGDRAELPPQLDSRISDYARDSGHDPRTVEDAKRATERAYRETREARENGQRNGLKGKEQKRLEREGVPSEEAARRADEFAQREIRRPEIQESITKGTAERIGRYVDNIAADPSKPDPVRYLADQHREFTGTAGEQRAADLAADNPALSESLQSSRDAAEGIRNELNEFNRSHPGVRGVEEWERRIDDSSGKLDQIPRDYHRQDNPGARENEYARLRNSERGANAALSGTRAEIEHAANLHDVSEVNQLEEAVDPNTGETVPADIDVKTDGGRQWHEIKNVEPRNMLDDNDPGRLKPEYRDQAERQLKVSYHNKDLWRTDENGAARPPKVHWDMLKGVDPAARAELENLTIVDEHGDPVLDHRITVDDVGAGGEEAGHGNDDGRPPAGEGDRPTAPTDPASHDADRPVGEDRTPELTPEDVKLDPPAEPAPTEPSEHQALPTEDPAADLQDLASRPEEQLTPSQRQTLDNLRDTHLDEHGQPRTPEEVQRNLDQRRAEGAGAVARPELDPGTGEHPGADGSAGTTQLEADRVPDSDRTDLPAQPDEADASSTGQEHDDNLYSREVSRTNQDVFDNGSDVPRTQEMVEQIAGLMDISLEGVDIHFVEDSEQIRYLDAQEACAYTPAELGGREIRLGPASFADHETLAATIAHEYTHVEQLRAGRDTGSGGLKTLEDEAYASEGPALAKFRERFGGISGEHGQVLDRGSLRSSSEGGAAGVREDPGGRGPEGDDPAGRGDRSERESPGTGVSNSERSSGGLDDAAAGTDRPEPGGGTRDADRNLFRGINDGGGRAQRPGPGQGGWQDPRQVPQGQHLAGWGRHPGVGPGHGAPGGEHTAPRPNPLRRVLNRLGGLFGGSRTEPAPRLGNEGFRPPAGRPEFRTPEGFRPPEPGRPGYRPPETGLRDWPGHPQERPQFGPRPDAWRPEAPRPDAWRPEAPRPDAWRPEAPRPGYGDPRAGMPARFEHPVPPRPTEPPRPTAPTPRADPLINARLAERHELVQDFERASSVERLSIRQDILDIDHELAESGYPSERLELPSMDTPVREVPTHDQPGHDLPAPEHDAPAWAQQDERPSIGDLVPRTEADAANWRPHIEETLRNELTTREYGGMRTEVSSVTVERNSVTVRLQIRHPEHGYAGRTNWSFDRERDGTLVARFHTLVVEKDLRGGGFATDLHEHLEGWFADSGVSHIEVHAAMDVGGYAWARAGYDWAPSEHHATGALSRLVRERNSLNEDISQLRAHLGGDHSVSVDDVLSRHSGTDPRSTLDSLVHQRDGADDVLDRARRHSFGSEHYPTPYDVSQAGWNGEHGRNASWAGKRAMLGSNWWGHKQIEPSAYALEHRATPTHVDSAPMWREPTVTSPETAAVTASAAEAGGRLSTDENTGGLPRHSVELPTQRYTDGARQVGQSLAERGYRPVHHVNAWGDGRPGGVETRWSHPSTGHEIRVRLDTPESRAAHQAGQDFRNARRTGETPDRLRYLADRHRAALQQVRTPVGAERVDPTADPARTGGPAGPGPQHPAPEQRPAPEQQHPAPGRQHWSGQSTRLPDSSTGPEGKHWAGPEAGTQHPSPDSSTGRDLSTGPAVHTVH